MLPNVRNALKIANLGGYGDDFVYWCVKREIRLSKGLSVVLSIIKDQRSSLESLLVRSYM